MDKEKFDNLWRQVVHIGKVEHCCDDAMLALGSVFGEMKGEIKRLQEKVKWLEMALREGEPHE